MPKKAIGLPDPEQYGDIGKLTPGEIVPINAQLHTALRAGEHTDFRLQSPEGLLSWAVRKGMPEPGAKHLAIRQPIHGADYFGWSGNIPAGYGAGDVVSKLEGKALVTKVDPNGVSFTTAHERYPQRFRLQQTEDKRWLLINVTPTEVREYGKVHYTQVPAEQVEKLFTPENLVTAKLDGSAAFVEVLGDKIESLSYRPSKVTGRPILHTERVGMPKPVSAFGKQLTVLRGELYGIKGCFSAQTMVTLVDGSKKPICCIKKGDLVKTPIGARRVLTVCRNGETDGWLEVCGNGDPVKVTSNHEFFVAKIGWVPIGLLLGCTGDLDDQGRLIPTDESMSQLWSRFRCISMSSEYEVLQSEMRSCVELEDTQAANYYSGRARATQTMVPRQKSQGQAAKMSVARRSGMVGGQLLQEEIIVFKHSEIGGLSSFQCLASVTPTRDYAPKDLGSGQLSSLRRGQKSCLERRDNSGYKSRDITESAHSGKQSMRAVRQNRGVFNRAPHCAQIDGGAKGQFSESVITLSSLSCSSGSISKKDGKRLFSVSRLPRSTRCRYDLEVEEAGCYYVGDFLVHNSKAIPAAELGGLLNSSIAVSLEKQRQRDIQLRHAVFDVLKYEGKDVTDLPYRERLNILHKALTKLPPSFHLPEGYTDPQKQAELWARIVSGHEPLTREGIVAHPLAGGTPKKAKTYPEADVIIRKMFPGKGSLANIAAGGFYYSLPSAPDVIVGKVGTGMTLRDRIDMQKNPEEWVGRTARIRAQEQFESGAYRAPAFIARHEDIAEKEAADQPERVPGDKPVPFTGFEMREGDEGASIETPTDISRREAWSTLLGKDRTNYLLQMAQKYRQNPAWQKSMKSLHREVDPDKRFPVSIGRNVPRAAAGQFIDAGGRIEMSEQWPAFRPWEQRQSLMHETQHATNPYPNTFWARRQSPEAAHVYDKFVKPWYGNELPVTSREFVPVLAEARGQLEALGVDTTNPADIFKALLDLRVVHVDGKKSFRPGGEYRGMLQGLMQDRFAKILQGLSTKDAVPLMKTISLLLPGIARTSQPTAEKVAGLRDPKDIIQALMEKRKRQVSVRSETDHSDVIEKKAELELDQQPETPSGGQKKAGNYRKGHAAWKGLNLTIETAKGQTRSGKNRDGKTWSTLMAHHYGYIRLTESEADGDHIDIFVGPDTDSELVFVVNQVRPDSGVFDEHKCMIGFKNREEARAGYLACYEKGWKGLGSMVEMTLPQFKEWLEHGDSKHRIEDTEKLAAYYDGYMSDEPMSLEDWVRLNRMLDEQAAEEARIEEDDVQDVEV